MDKERYIVAVGAVCTDEYYTADEWPVEGNKSLVKSVDEKVGGMIPNAACVFAGYGVKTYYYDVINHSLKSQKLMEDLQSYGLDTSPVVYDPTLPDTKCIIVLTPGDRTILVVDAQKPVLELTGDRLKLFRNASYIYTTVYEMKHFKNPVALIKDLKAHGAQIVFDVEVSNCNEDDLELFKCADVLFFNEYSLERFRGSLDEETYVQKLFDSGVKIITVTLGEKGSVTYTPTDRNRTKAVCFDVVDPTGAGDTFNSSFVRCLLEGMDIHSAARFANMAASYSITKPGPKGGVNSVKNVETLIKKYAEVLN